MKVRLAKIVDLSDIVAFAKGALASTNYSELPYNGVIARRTVKDAMLQPTSRVWVIDDNGRIRGLLIAEIGPLPMTHFMGASDVAFLAEAGGDLLLDAYLDWCKLNNVKRIDLGISAGPAREAAIRRAMARKGFVYSGPMFHLHLGESSRECAQENP